MHVPISDVPDATLRRKPGLRVPRRRYRRVNDEYPPYSISHLCLSLDYCSYRSVFYDAAQCRHSQRKRRSSAGHDRLGSTPSAVATGSYRPELIDNCCAAGWSKICLKIGLGQLQHLRSVPGHKREVAERYGNSPTSASSCSAAK
jgi:hypothetical protein